MIVNVYPLISSLYTILIFIIVTYDNNISTYSSIDPKLSLHDIYCVYFHHAGKGIGC